MKTSTILDRLIERHNLSPEEAEFAFSALMDGEMTPSQAGAFLLTLRAKGETPQEMSAAVQGALQRAHLVTGVAGDYADVVGTGGDGKQCFNCSTATALTLAGLGCRIVKHGNRAVSSSSGAADALELLGYPLDLDAASIADSVEKYGFAFCFAPHFHPCFKNIAPIRRELGVRTLFNLLGPMINPSRPPLMMMGVASPQLVPAIAAVLAQGGSYRRALVFCGAGGYDELTLFGPATACLVQGTEVRRIVLTPEEWGFEVVPPTPENEAALQVATREEAAAALRALLAGQGTPAMAEMTAFNVAVGLWLFYPELSKQECTDRARLALAGGVGGNIVKSWS